MTARLIGTTLLLLSSAAVATPVYAQRSHFGPHIAYNFDIKETAIGAQAHLPISHGVEFYPSFDYYFVNNYSLWALNLDLKIRPPSRYGAFYFGGGVDLMHASVNGVGGSTTNLNLLAGLEGHRRSGNPYLEARLILGDGSAFQMAVGFSWR